MTREKAIELVNSYYISTRTRGLSDDYYKSHIYAGFDVRIEKSVDSISITLKYLTEEIDTFSYSINSGRITNSVKNIINNKLYELKVDYVLNNENASRYLDFSSKVISFKLVEEDKLKDDIDGVFAFLKDEHNLKISYKLSFIKIESFLKSSPLQFSAEVDLNKYIKYAKLSIGVVVPSYKTYSGDDLSNKIKENDYYHNIRQDVLSQFSVLINYRNLDLSSFEENFSVKYRNRRNNHEAYMNISVETEPKKTVFSNF